MMTGPGCLSTARSCARSPLLAQGWCSHAVQASHHRSSAHSALPGLAAPALAQQGVPRALLPTDGEHLTLAARARIVHELPSISLPELGHEASVTVEDPMLEVEALIVAHEAGLASAQSAAVPQHAVAGVASPAQEADCADSATARSSGTASTSSCNSSSGSSQSTAELSGRRRGAARSTPSRTRGRGGGGSGAAPAALPSGARTGAAASKPANTKPAPVAAPPASAAADSAAAAAPVALSVEGAAALADLQGRTPSLAAVDSAQLGQRLAALATLLKLGTDVAAMPLCEAVPGLLLQEPAALDRSWRRLRHAVAGTDDQVRRAICAAPLLLLLPSSRVSQVSGVLATALGVPQQRARSLIRDVPALFAMPPATLSEKLTGLEHLQLGWRELHGRCRWLRRLILSNGYYHAALRRLPPSLLAALVAALPGCWARLQYLADSNQEGALPLMEAVECEQAAFEARHPEFAKWYSWKVKQMGTDNPWRGARRVRGIGSAPAAATGVKPRRSYARRNGQQQSQQAGTDQQPTVPVVLTEAGMVRSGGATVNRPRRVVQQRLNEPAEGEAAALVDVVEPAMAGSAATANDGDVVAVDQPAAAAPREGAAPDSPRRRSRR